LQNAQESLRNKKNTIDDDNDTILVMGGGGEGKCFALIVGLNKNVHITQPVCGQRHVHHIIVVIIMLPTAMKSPDQPSRLVSA